KLVLVRTRGLWGSSFSYGWDGTPPPFLTRLLQGFGVLWANLLFFAPRRDVTMTVEVLDRSQLPGVERDVLNPFLERWYNPDGTPETPTFVPYHFLLGPRTREFPTYQGLGDVDLTALKPETRQAVDEIISHKLDRPLSDAEKQPDT